jgi:hypothetical protein
MDYTFGEQAYETIIELLKPLQKMLLWMSESVSILGKAGILEGRRYRSLTHTHQWGTADNYFSKVIKCWDVLGNDIAVLQDDGDSFRHFIAK